MMKKKAYLIFTYYLSHMISYSYMISCRVKVSTHDIIIAARYILYII